jgi:hypothetical protein
MTASMVHVTASMVHVTASMVHVTASMVHVTASMVHVTASMDHVTNLTPRSASPASKRQMSCSLFSPKPRSTAHVSVNTSL